MQRPYLTVEPISWDRIAELNRWAAREGCGAVVTFVGVVRADRCGARTIQALRYDAYAEMAEQLIRHSVEEAMMRWSLTSAHIQHRLGLVDVGHPSVVVVVAAPHRDHAYAASQFLIERIKQHAPVWKREHYHDSTSQWMGQRMGPHAHV